MAKNNGLATELVGLTLLLAVVTAVMWGLYLGHGQSDAMFWIAIGSSVTLGVSIVAVILAFMLG